MQIEHCFVAPKNVQYFPQLDLRAVLFPIPWSDVYQVTLRIWYNSIKVELKPEIFGIQVSLN